MLNSSDSHCLIVKSRGGLGKTNFVLSELKKGDKEYAYFNGHITPKETFCILRDNFNRLIVFDDVDAFLAQKVNVGLLKSALYPNLDGQRIVSYASSTDKTMLPFVFEGKVVLLCNRYPKNLDFDAVLSRSLAYVLNPSNAEVVKAILSHETKPNLEVISFLSKLFGTHKLFGFREYHLVKRLALNHVDWQELAIPLLTKVDKYSLIRDLMNGGASVSEQIEAYKSHGYSRATYFRHKRGVVLDE